MKKVLLSNNEQTFYDLGNVQSPQIAKKAKIRKSTLGKAGYGERFKGVPGNSFTEKIKYSMHRSN